MFPLVAPPEGMTHRNAYEIMQAHRKSPIVHRRRQQTQTTRTELTRKVIHGKYFNYAHHSPQFNLSSLLSKPKSSNFAKESDMVFPAQSNTTENNGHPYP